MAGDPAFACLNAFQMVHWISSAGASAPRAPRRILLLCHCFTEMMPAWKNSWWCWDLTTYNSCVKGPGAISSRRCWCWRWRWLQAYHVQLLEGNEAVLMSHYRQYCTSKV